MGMVHPKVPYRRYQYLTTLERKHWTLEEKLGALLLEGWENLQMYNLESGFQYGMLDLCQESGVKYLRLRRDVLIFVFCRKSGEKKKGLKWLEMF